MSDDKKLSLGNRDKPSGGRGRPSFGQGRNKPVVVEVKRRKFQRKDTPAPSTPAAQDENRFKPHRTSDDRALEMDDEISSKAELLKDAMRQDEIRRKQEAEEAARRAEEEAKKAEEDAARSEEEKREAAEEEARKQAEQSAKAAAEEEAQRKVAEEAALAAQLAEREAAGIKTKHHDEDEKAKDHKKPSFKKPAPGRPAKRSGDRRRSGKLTVARALEGGDETRTRSLASLKRAQAKHKRQGEADNKPKKIREVVVPESITVQELANRMAERAADVIKALMNMGVMATINENLDQDTAELVVGEFGHQIKRVAESDVEIGMIGEDDKDEDKTPRAPVVTVMGHVDHGKTSLLDALRATDVAAGEAGGITQHIGAYQVQLKSGSRITFLDTPGHEAFTQMRARGAGVTDIVVLVVAADDGIMPQTIEAINHAKAAEVPIIVAINKMDKEGANPDKVRQDLLQHEIIVESMSGDVLDIEVSAKIGKNLDKLEEAILLQAELMELKANPDRPAEGIIIEAELDKGRGPVATVLISRGTLNAGDIVVAGAEWGRVRAMTDDRGKQQKSAGPSQPVEVLGLQSVPSAGDDFAVVENEARAREISAYRQSVLKKKRVGTGPASLESMFTALKEAQAIEFPVVVKADVQGSLEAISQALEKAGNEEIKARLIHGAVGGISETDVSLAHASGALIVGFNVRANKQAREAANRDGVPIQYYSIIYDLVDGIKSLMAGELDPEIHETIIGMAEVKDVFTAGKLGKAAGCMILEGIAKKDAKARLLRDDTVIYTGNITSLRRFKDDVNKVEAGTECGIALENYTDIKAGDTLEFFEEEEKERTL